MNEDITAQSPVISPASEEEYPFFGPPRRVHHRGQPAMEFPLGDLQAIHVADVPRDLISTFIRLDSEAGAEVEAITAFASKWGALGLCEEHYLPFHHSALCRQSPFEPFAVWLQIVRHIRGLLTVGLSLNDGKAPSAEEWEQVDEWRPEEVRSWAPTADMLGELGTVQASKIAANALLSWWRGAAGVQLDSWWGETLVLTPSGSGLASDLTLRVHAVIQSGLFRCQGCKLPIPVEGTRRRRPKTGQNTWCSSCRDRVRWRVAAKDRYWRSRAGSTKE